MIAPFSIGRLPRIEFGAGQLPQLPIIAGRYGRRLLFVTGERSFTETAHWESLQHALTAASISYDLVRIAGEPSPEQIDAIVRARRLGEYNLVVGIGGGSVLDAAKAVAGLLRPGNTVMDHSGRRRSGAAVSRSGDAVHCCPDNGRHRLGGD